MNSIKEIWKNQSASFKNEVIKQRIEEINSLNCSIGTISFSKAKIFTLELDSHVNVLPNYLKRFIGVEVQVLPITEKQKELVLILLEEELTDVFIMFIEDIIQCLLPINDSEEALSIISNRINYWRKLFGKFTGGLLTPQQQRGLYGELYFLQLLLESQSNHERIINAWQAPEGTNQDFYFNGKAVEVKTSIANNPTIKIANEYQLDLTGLQRLYIAFYRLSEYPDDENTLLNIITKIRNILNLSIDLKKEFNLKLESIGLAPEAEDEYNKTGYSIRSEIYYQVNDIFPKITTAILDDAVSRVSYEIAPNECKDYGIEFTTILNELSNG
ncbi:MAG: PD-(D/E)XK motif protein [Prolixibacteraceae bacterium]|jgi:hypothetical protein|nr:PD-(D/E)XK motif protein [Prolixibacteraceae bacterium]